jgi:ABC-type Fe3+/spermidine/putrescine transport system ATPase subunit
VNVTAHIEVEDVWLNHGSTAILRGTTFSAEPGETVALVGPSGSGKTTLLRLILGLLPPTRGIVRLDGKIVSRDGQVLQPPEARVLAAVFQHLALWPHLTVFENLAFGLESQRVLREERNRLIIAILTRVGLADKAQRYPGQLSGGEQQRVAVARAMVYEPRAILFDEPLTNLDVLLRTQLLTLVTDLLHEHETTAIYVTHDCRDALTLGGRIAVLEDGRIVQSGTTEQLRARPATLFVEAFVKG